MVHKHLKRYPGREVDSVKREFATIYCRKALSGDPNIPEYVHIAEQFKKDISDMEENSTFNSKCRRLGS